VRGSLLNAVLESACYDNYIKAGTARRTGGACPAEGLSTEEFINRELERLVIASAHPMAGLTPEERVRRWDEWVKSHDYIKAPPLSDYAVSRESIYTREDEML